MLVVTAAALALVVVCLFNLPFGRHQQSVPTVPINTSEIAQLNLQLNNSSDPVTRANSALRLSVIATRQIENGVTTTSSGTSPDAIQKRLNRALAAETDANARETITSAIAQIRNHEIMQGSLNPLTQRFK